MNSVPYFTGWDSAANLLESEIVQIMEEGRDPLWIKELTSLSDLKHADEAVLAEIWSRLQEAPFQPGFAFVEPNGLEAPVQSRPSGKIPCMTRSSRKSSIITPLRSVNAPAGVSTLRKKSERMRVEILDLDLSFSGRPPNERLAAFWVAGL